MKRNQFIILLCFIIVSFSITTGVGCNSGRKKSKEVLRGEQLAAQVCSSCHLPVSPDMLDKKTWTEHVLPAMAPHVGIQVWGQNQYFQDIKAGSKAVVSYGEWMAIVKYFESEAPDSLLPAPLPVPYHEEGQPFVMKAPQWTDTTQVAGTTMVWIDTIRRYTWSADNTGRLFRWNAAMESKQVAQLRSPVVNILPAPDAIDSSALILTLIGDMRATDLPQGEILKMQVSADTAKPLQSMALAMPRPLQTVPFDGNKDGLTDYIVCGFGHNAGGLYILQRHEEDEEFSRIDLREVPGATQVVTGDFNGDGWPDIMALFAHAQEGIWMFLNDGKGGYNTKEILQFPPVYGSTSFQLIDFNHDGRLDMLYTCGDNSDYSMVLKPYHGVYLFENKGDFKYEQAFFYPVNGCTKAVAADFDGDGDLDIVTIAFFSDLKNRPGEKLLYFEHQSQWRFVPYTLPGQREGRWITMDVNDIDGDGDPDVVLGNFSQGFMIQDGLTPYWNKFRPVCWLQNTTR
ncbi:VCBS repeat-containing protein [Chitinophaga pendula]|uniref:FG-GAP repeat domain-containing protein n=1 Tax=Chitinophaga TaxID=79328 RepID=UPI0012FDE454|nr:MULTISPECIES: VCBS repeat-containing protein [Chitinophaga]UCJ07284.1 VCBS repeat-containing protein [Chitinophaga pendula]